MYTTIFCELKRNRNGYQKRFMIKKHRKKEQTCYSKRHSHCLTEAFVKINIGSETAIFQKSRQIDTLQLMIEGKTIYIFIDIENAFHNISHTFIA